MKRILKMAQWLNPDCTIAQMTINNHLTSESIAKNFAFSARNFLLEDTLNYVFSQPLKLNHIWI